jgi:hypothetical protein
MKNVCFFKDILERMVCKMKNKWFVGFCRFLVFGSILTGCASDGNGGEIYAIGDTGPGGGLVFYDKGEYSDGWRYMECAPVSTEKGARWGLSDKVVNNDADVKLALEDELEFGGTATDIGTGASNTKAIVAILSTHGKSNRAAQICDALSYGGKDDWFLPSKDELYEIYMNLAAKGLGDFPNHGAVNNSDGDWYWSSSEVNNTHAWSQNTGDGNVGENPGSQGGIIKIRPQFVRAVRAF